MILQNGVQKRCTLNARQTKGQFSFPSSPGNYRFFFFQSLQISFYFCHFIYLFLKNFLVNEFYYIYSCTTITTTTFLQFYIYEIMPGTFLLNSRYFEFYCAEYWMLLYFSKYSFEFCFEMQLNYLESAGSSWALLLGFVRQVPSRVEFGTTSIEASSF